MTTLSTALYHATVPLHMTATVTIQVLGKVLDEDLNTDTQAGLSKSTVIRQKSNNRPTQFVRTGNIDEKAGHRRATGHE